MKKKTQKKLLKLYNKSVCKIVYILLKGNRDRDEVIPALDIVQEMINDFTKVVFLHEFNENNSSDKEKCFKIITESLINLSVKTNSYVPETSDIDKVHDILAVMSNKISTLTS